MNTSNDPRRPCVALLVPQMRHGGAERVVSRLYEELKGSTNVVVVVFDDAVVGYGMAGLVTSLAIPPKKNSLVIMRAVRAGRRAIAYRAVKARLGVDITYSFGDTANIASILSGYRDKKIVSLRGFARIRTAKDIRTRLLLRPLSKWVCNHADLIVCVSQLMADTLLKEYGLRPEKVVCIPNAIDGDAIYAAGSGTGTETSTNLHERYICAVGSYRPEKRFDHLLRGFAAANLPDQTRLVVCGSDPYGMKSALRRLADELGVGERVDLLPFQENPFFVMGQAAVFVLSSSSEGFPNALIEAMACGTPVVATDCASGPREILAPNTAPSTTTRTVEWAEYGVLVPPPGPTPGPTDDPLMLAGVLETLLWDEGLRRDLGERSRFRALQYGTAPWVRKHNELFEQVKALNS